MEDEARIVFETMEPFVGRYTWPEYNLWGSVDDNPLQDMAPSNAGDAAGPSAAIPQLENAHSLEANATGLAEPDPYSVDIDLSTATDKDVVHFLHAKYKHYKEKKLCRLEDNATQPDPWDLPRRWYISWKKFGSDEKTPQGYWKEKDNEFTAIRGDLWLQRRPMYIGFKRTLEFHMNDGTKTDWLMHEYAMLHQSDGHFFLKEEIVISEVSKKDQDGVLNPSRDMANNGEPADEPNRNNISHSGQPHHGAVQSDQAPSGKRLRTDDRSIRVSESEVWQEFTRIYIHKDDESKKKESKKLLYAVCHHCDRVFKASSKNGTSSLRRHTEVCQCKHFHQAC